MNTEQIILLEKIINDSINKALELNNPSFISLIKIAKEKNLFFPEYYETIFIEGLHKSFFWEVDYVLENYFIFGLDIKATGYIYSDVWLYQNATIKKLYANNFEQNYIKLENALTLGIVLEEDFFNKKDIINNISEEHIKILKRLNKKNLNHYLKTITLIL